ncbi:MAG: bifunctional diguanylate cyclase/phosphodiesterase [Mariprofundus sp.]|nr:bifunctional diguanylate cyclase/phosphodiesterase [Mariprofundus sp.]
MIGKKQIAEIYIHGQPHIAIAYYKVLYLTLNLGVPQERAEAIAMSVTTLNEPLRACLIHCEIEIQAALWLLIIRSDELREQVNLPAWVNDAAVDLVRERVMNQPVDDLLVQSFAAQQQLLQQRDRLSQENERLSTKLMQKGQQMQRQSMHDEMTGLANRSLLIERSAHAFQLAKRDNFYCALMAININQFKYINDTRGHQFGDLLLQEISHRMKDMMRESDTLARVGSDEFIALLLNSSAIEAKEVSEKLHKALSTPFDLQGEWISITLRVGIVEFPTHAEALTGLLQYAEVALSQAKEKQLNQVIYNPLNDQKSVQKSRLFMDFKQAISANKLILYYQPQVDISQHGFPSMEALIRWPHPEKGTIFPDQFIPMAEESGLIIPLSYWVLETAIAQAVAWSDLGMPVRISVNLTGQCLLEASIVERISSYISKYGLPDHRLVLEITDEVIMAEPSQAAKVLRALDKIKVDVSITNLGTGYSSFAYLQHLLVDELKIDRSFIMGMDASKSDDIIVRTLINMAHSIGLRVIAEGVESVESWDRLAAMKCDRIQGYVISRAIPVDQATSWLQRFASEGLGPSQ